jgi:hypothetical protein
MIRDLLALVASAATLALANVAMAEEADSAGFEEPILLTSAQMDGVTAAGAFVSADLTGDAIVNGSFFLDNLPGVFSVAQISANIQPISGVPMLVLTANANTFN